MAKEKVSPPDLPRRADLPTTPAAGRWLARSPRSPDVWVGLSRCLGIRHRKIRCWYVYVYYRRRRYILIRIMPAVKYINICTNKHKTEILGEGKGASGGMSFFLAKY